MRISVLNGVNLNILGRRDPALYGGLTIAELESRIYEWARELELPSSAARRTTRASSSSGATTRTTRSTPSSSIPARGRTTRGRSTTRSSPSTIPIVEVHLSNVDEREEWRRKSVVSDLVAARFIGHGPDGYKMALEYLKEQAE